MSTNQTSKLFTNRPGTFWRLAAAITVILLMPMTTLAFEFEAGDLEGSIDTTLSYGAAWRVDGQDPALIGDNNGGNAFSVNGDDGNLNYDKGDLISSAAKITSEMALQYNNFGLFVRGLSFYDFENNDGERRRTALREEALDLVGTDIRLLDAYASWDFDVAEMPAQIRVGDQVISWGESTFIQNSINSINPVEVSKLRVPGAELKEALIPVGIVSASISPTDNISIEGFYQYTWVETVIDPPGSYWSTNDFAGEGGNKVMLGFGAAPDSGNAAALDTFLAVPRTNSRAADDAGQYGLAFRVFAPALNNTEFGFYYMNYHSRLPLISAVTGTQQGFDGFETIAVNGGGITVAGTAGAAFAADPTDPNAAITAGVIAGLGLGMTQTQAGLIAKTTVTGGNVADAIGQAATDAYARTARYQTEYPEDIQLFGVSFNTQIESTETAIQGEVSYRIDSPLQVDDIELLFAALGPINPGLAALNQVGNFSGQFATDIRGYILRDVTQAQLTATQVFGPTFGADQFVLLGEVGITHILDMPDKDDLRLDAPGTYVSGNQALAAAGVHGSAAAGYFEPASAFADATSWGYRIVSRLDFNNAVGAVTLSPRVAWAHDVSGTTPGPGGNFIEDRMAVTLGLEANYLNSWTADLSYTDFFGAGRYNLANDRDFLAMNIKYSF